MKLNKYFFFYCKITNMIEVKCTVYICTHMIICKCICIHALDNSIPGCDKEGPEIYCYKHTMKLYAY